MEKLIWRYLSKHFSIGEEFILAGSNKIYGATLLTELKKVFAIEKSVAKALVEVWVRQNAPKFNLVGYWVREPDVMPILQRVMARTVAMDLVSVQPMNMPTGSLFYFDAPNANDRIYSSGATRE